MEDTDETEVQHFLDVCYSCLQYRGNASWELVRLRKAVANLDECDSQLWGLDIKQWMDQLQAGVKANSDFLELLPCPDICSSPLPDPSIVLKVPRSHTVEPQNVSKVRSTLRQFVRDWAIEGKAERECTYAPMIRALEKYLPPPQLSEDGEFPEEKPRVVCPGSGLGRLPFDLARRGYAAQGNEFSYHMLLGSNLVLNTTEEDEKFTIYPFILNFANRRSMADCLRAVQVPDVCPFDVLPESAELSMAAGEFVDIYKDQHQEWDAVATAFFLDTAKNVFLYIRTFANIIRPGGLWVNLGPLLYHYAEVHEEISVELSWEEVRPFLCQYFDLVEEERRDAAYTSTPASISRTVYHCIFFVARRNSRSVDGKSNPVY